LLSCHITAQYQSPEDHELSINRHEELKFCTSRDRLPKLALPCKLKYYRDIKTIKCGFKIVEGKKRRRSKTYPDSIGYCVYLKVGVPSSPKLETLYGSSKN
jgi:hypothetical protein